MTTIKDSYLQILQLAKDRRKKSFTQSEIAEFINVTPIRIHNLEAGKTVDYELLELYCAILGIDIKLTYINK